MQFIETKFPGVLIIEPRVFKDDRGFFFESYRQDTSANNGLNIEFIQDNHARSETKHVLRGLHFQTPPFAQSKLVRVTLGAVLDVVVDLRVGSPMYGKWGSFELSADNFRQLFIPQGFAHAYMTLTDVTEFVYKVDNYYAPNNDAGLRWDDPDLGIAWPCDTPILSEKDKNLPFFKDFDSPFTYTP